MGKSRKNVPIFGNADASEKMDKRRNNRKLRKRVKQLTDEMKKVSFDEMLEIQNRIPSVNEVSDPWVMSKDGKRYINSEDFDIEKAMRK